MRFFCFIFFSQIILPQAPGNNIRIISNFLENSRSQCAPRVTTTTTANFATGRVGVVDTGGKIARGVNDTGDKLVLFWLKIFPFATGVNDTNGVSWSANISTNFREKKLKRP